MLHYSIGFPKRITIPKFHISTNMPMFVEPFMRRRKKKRIQKQPCWSCSEIATEQWTYHKSNNSYHENWETLWWCRRRGCWDCAKNCGVRRCRIRQCTRAIGGRVGRAIAKRNVELLVLLAMTRFTAGEVKVPQWSEIEQRVAIVHVQDWIFEVAAGVGLCCDLNHWILAWWVQKHCITPEKRTNFFLQWFCNEKTERTILKERNRKLLQRESPILNSWVFDHLV